MSVDIRNLYKQLYIKNFQELEQKQKLAYSENENNKQSISTYKRMIRGAGFRFEPSVFKPFFIFLLSLLLPILIYGFYSQIKNDMINFYKFLIYLFLFIFIIFSVIIVINLSKNLSRIQIQTNTINKENYEKIYCEKIFKPIIENVIPNSFYEYNKGISKNLYERMGFSNAYEIFISSSNIELKNNNIILSKVNTKFRNNFTGSRYIGSFYDDLFYGIASVYTMPIKIPFYIKIRNKKVDSLKLKKENRIQLNNDEFNEYYEIETNNEKLLNKIFTTSMFEYFIDLIKNKNQHLEVNIVQNYICIRLHDKNFLEFDLTDLKNNEQIIINSCNSIIAILDTNNFIANEFKKFI